MTKISIIIPVYNTEEYLTECLESVINQTLKEIEIIIINDASPDNSIEIIKRFMSNDSRIVLIDKKHNEGVGKARNDGIDKAKGEFVCFMDSDDLYSENDVLEALYHAAKENHVPVSGGRLELLEDKGTIHLKENPFSEYGIDFYQNGMMNYSDFQYDYNYQCYLISRKLITENDIYFPYYSRFQDPPFFIKAMNAAGSYYFIDKPVYRYRLLPSASKFSSKKTLDLLDGIMDNLNYSRENSLAKLHYQTAMRLYKDASFMAAKNINDDDFPLLLEKFITVMNLVNKKMIEAEGYNLPNPFLPEVFSYMRNATVKYENLRNNKIFKIASKVLKH
ncbi:MAG: glycosyltransferase family 2 protein [Eubacterium sp.]|nr:glycosyltransferase family 2 protein [Eubacterium sp.]